MNSEQSQHDARLTALAPRFVSRRRLLQGGVGLTAGAALARLPSRVAGAQETKGGRLVIGRGEDSQSLDPIRSGTFSNEDVMKLIYDTLTVLDMDGNVAPNLAESWEISEDGKEYTFKLHDGVMFHDGTMLDAAAVKAHFDRTIDPKSAGRSAGWIDQLQETRVVDDLTVTMVLQNPWAPLLATLTVAAFGIPSPTAVEAAGEDFGQKPVGSGPFVFQEWIPGDHITLVKNPAYRSFLPYGENKGAPYLDEVVWRVIPETQSLVASFEEGEVNLVNLPPQHIKDFTDRPGFTLYSKPDAGTVTNFVEFNFFKPPFDDLRVRQAFAHAIDIDAIIATVLEGQAKRDFCFMPVGLPGWAGPQCEEHGYSYDPTKASALLDEAGWAATGGGVREKEGQPLQILMTTYSGFTGVFPRALEVIQGNAADIGFMVDIQSFDIGIQLARISAPDNESHCDLVNWGWPTSHLLYMMTHSEQPLGRYRQSDAAHAQEFETVIDQTLSELDPDKRAALYGQAELLLLEDAASVPMYSDIYTFVTRDSVKGFALGPLVSSSHGIFVLQDTYVEG